MRLKIFLLGLLLSSCASKNYASKQSILDLSRTSYLKGCVDSKIYFSKLKSGESFEKCVQMSKDHEKEISIILE